MPVASQFKTETFSDDDDAVDAPPVLEATPHNRDESTKPPGTISKTQERPAKKPSLSSIFIEQPVWLCLRFSSKSFSLQKRHKGNSATVTIREGASIDLTSLSVR